MGDLAELSALVLSSTFHETFPSVLARLQERNMTPCAIRMIRSFIELHARVAPAPDTPMEEYYALTTGEYALADIQEAEYVRMFTLSWLRLCDPLSAVNKRLRTMLYNSTDRAVTYTAISNVCGFSREVSIALDACGATRWVSDDETMTVHVWTRRTPDKFVNSLRTAWTRMTQYTTHLHFPRWRRLSQLLDVRQDRLK